MHYSAFLWAADSMCLAIPRLKVRFLQSNFYPKWRVRPLPTEDLGVSPRYDVTSVFLCLFLDASPECTISVGMSKLCLWWCWLKFLHKDRNKVSCRWGVKFKIRDIVLYWVLVSAVRWELFMLLNWGDEMLISRKPSCLKESESFWQKSATQQVGSVEMMWTVDWNLWD